MEEVLKFIDERIKLHNDTLHNAKFSSPFLKDEVRARLSELNLLHKKVKELYGEDHQTPSSQTETKKH